MHMGATKTLFNTNPTPTTPPSHSTDFYGEPIALE